MTLIEKIKSYFISREFGSWKDYDFERHEFRFSELDHEVLMDLARYLPAQLHEADEIVSKRSRLKASKAITANSIDELLVHVSHSIDRDFRQTSKEAKLHGWRFSYFVAPNPLCAQTLCIVNGLQSQSPTGNCLYTVVSLRKKQGRYYFWEHLG